MQAEVAYIGLEWSHGVSQALSIIIICIYSIVLSWRHLAGTWALNFDAANSYMSGIHSAVRLEEDGAILRREFS